MELESKAFVNLKQHLSSPFVEDLDQFNLFLTLAWQESYCVFHMYELLHFTGSCFGFLHVVNVIGVSWL